MNREEIISTLKNKVCTVVFNKVSGEKRTMTCTLQEELLPVVSKTTTTTYNSTSEDTVRCYDVENAGWRSFRVDSVIDFS